MASPTKSTVAAAPAPGRIRRVARALYWLAVFGLVALNGWWLWDARPMPRLRDVEGWIAVDHDGGSMPRAWWDVPHDAVGARAALWRAVRKSPHDAAARMLLGRALAAANDLQGCVEQLRLVPDWSARKPEAQYLEGIVSLERHRLRDAERAFLAYVEPVLNDARPRPNLAEVKKRILDIYGFEDRWDEARALLWSDFAETEPSPRERLAIVETVMRTHMERSRPSATVEVLTPAVAADPEDWEARRALAVAADAAGDAPRADELIAKCLKQRPGSPRAWGDRLEMLERREEFAALAIQMAKVPPDAEADGRIAMIRGRLFRQEKKYEASIVALRRALKLLPDDLAGHHLLAQSLQSLGRDAEAAEERARHAFLLKASDDLPGAINHFKDVTEAARPESSAVAESMRRLADACRRLGWEKEAEAWAELAEAQ